MPDSHQHDIFHQLGSHTAEIQAIKEAARESVENQRLIRQDLDEIKQTLSEWKGTSKTVLGIAAAVTAIITAVITEVVIGWASKLFGGH